MIGREPSNMPVTLLDTSWMGKSTRPHARYSLDCAYGGPTSRLVFAVSGTAMSLLGGNVVEFFSVGAPTGLDSTG